MKYCLCSPTTLRQIFANAEKRGSRISKEDTGTDLDFNSKVLDANYVAVLAPSLLAQTQGDHVGSFDVTQFVHTCRAICVGARTLWISLNKCSDRLLFEWLIDQWKQLPFVAYGNKHYSEEK